MSELDRAPLIGLDVDQEVFVDSVREGDVIEDATVATEVTSFEKVGDAYVLEGAIVFAGYLKHADAGDGQTQDAGDILSFGDDDGFVQHIHHRLPFYLRVPVKAQSRGIVNVKSRISNWRLDVISAGWVRIAADLNIVGLAGERGYHFQCGTQEEGDLLFSDSAEQENLVLPAQAPVSPEYARGGQPGEAASDEGQSHVEASRGENDAPTAAGDAEEGAIFDIRHADSSSSVVDEEFTAAKFDRDKEAGREQSAEDYRSLEAAEPLADAEDLGVAARNDLTEFDRVFSGSTPEMTRSVPEFEFEHQLTTSELGEQTRKTAAPDGQFVASRSFGEDGFRPASGFQSDQVRTTISSQPQTYTPQAVDEADASGVAQENEARETRGETEYPSKTDASLWSFVDFNVPDRRYTLRYVVVMDDETLDSVAERVGCSKMELMRANQVSIDQLRAGQTLKVPVPHPSNLA